MVRKEYKTLQKRIENEPRRFIQAFIKSQKPDKTILVGSSGIPWQDFIQMDIEKLFD